MKKCELKEIIDLELELLEDEDDGFFDNPDF